MKDRRIVKVFPEEGGAEAWRTKVMCDDGTIWLLDDSHSNRWRVFTAPDAIPPRASVEEPQREPSLFERVFGRP